MGGKNKAQRTKNNVRPSSSGRSAELLGSSIPAFVGFSTVKEGSFIPAIPGFSRSAIGTEDIDPNLDNNFQLVLKKMNKKDSVTKIKALQEFTELVNNTEPESVKSVLAFWPRLYCLLAVDVEHRVREAAHVAQRAVAMKAKRNLVPYLKQLVGPWFTSQYDSYAPAASSAKQSFEDAFPPNKLTKVIIFCQEEILGYICDNLTVQTPQSLCNAKTATAEESEAKYQRILITSLQGYTLYLHKVPQDEIKIAFELNKKIISNVKFWELSKHKIPLVRSAWFGVLTSLCQKAPFLLTDEVNRVTSTVMANLDESDPIVVPSVWEAALLALSTVEDWWTHVNVDKLILPKLWRVLREAGQGNANSIYPNLLPLISKFPPGPDAHKFYSCFFENMRLGFKQRSVIQSKLELSAVAVSFTECLRYVILKNQCDTVLCEFLLNSQLIPLIEWCIIDGHAASKIVFNQISVLIHYWSKNRQNTEHINYKNLVNNFFAQLSDTFVKILTDSKEIYDTEARSTIIQKQSELILSLKRNTNSKFKKHLKVQFFSSEKISETSESLESNSTNSSDNIDDLYIKELNLVVYTLLGNYMNILIKNFNPDLLSQFCTLAQEFESFELFEYLNLKSSTTEQNNIIELYTNIFCNWLNKSKDTQKPVLDLIFTLFKYLDPCKKSIVLESFSKLEDKNILRGCIAQALSHPYRTEPIVREWLCSGSVTDLFISSAKTVLKEADTANPEHMLLIRQGCTQDENGELLISRRALEKIVEIFCEPLIKPKEHLYILDTCARFTSVLSAYLYSDVNATTYGTELLLALFTLNCNTKISTDSLSKDTLWEVETAWQDAVTVISSIEGCNSDAFTNLTHKFTTIITNELFSCENITEAILDRIGVVIVGFIISQTNFEVENISNVTDYFLSAPKNIIHTWLLDLISVTLSAEVLSGNFSYSKQIPSFQFDNIDASMKIQLDCNKLIAWGMLTAKILKQLYETPKTTENNDENEDTDDYEDDEIGQKEPTLKSSTDKLNEHIIKIILIYTVCKSYMDFYKNSSDFNSLQNDIVLFKKHLKSLLDSVEDSLLDQIKKLILSKARSEGSFWARSLYILNLEFLHLVPDMAELFNNSVSTKNCDFTLTDNGYLHILQVFSKHISYDQIDIENKSSVDSLIIARCVPMSEDTVIQIMEALGVVRAIRSSDEKAMLFDSDVSKFDWVTVETASEVIRLLASIVSQQPFQLTSGQWDFISIGLASWTDSVQKSSYNIQSLQVSNFIVAVFELFNAVTIFMRNIENDVATGPGYKNLTAEWKDVVSGDVNKGILTTWLHIIDKYNVNDRKQLMTIHKIGESILHTTPHVIFNPKYGMKWQRFLAICIDKLQSTNPAIQLSAYVMLQHISQGLVEIDTQAFSSESVNIQELILNKFKNTLLNMQDIVEAMLLDFKLAEDSCRVEPYTDAFAYTCGYLLLWSLILSMINEAPSYLRYQYADWVRDGDYLKHLIQNLIRLMPVEILRLPSAAKSYLFTNKPSMEISGPRTSEWLESYVCWVYSNALSWLPALVRQWWSGIETRVSRVVDAITAACVSPQLCSRELQAITKHDPEFNNMIVKVRPQFKEVIATYTVDEAHMELSIALPYNYPLGPVRVKCSQQIGATAQWRNSLMQLSLFLTHQNGSVWDGLLLWKSNLDKHFDGVEECNICFSVIHAGTYQLPKLVCQTCRKKFHSACLYKWFSTSNKSTCPICRNLF